MKNKYIKLKIEENFNLEKLSKEFEINSKELIAFHNKHCEIHELLSTSLPKYVEYIYLPIEKFKVRESQLLENSKLKLPIAENSKTYGVIVKFSHKDKQLHYKIQVKRESSFVELQKEKSYINNHEVEKIAEQIFEKTEQALYPLKISVENNGSFRNIENIKEISSRWKGKYFPQLKEYYVGEVADEILSKIDNSFKKLDSKKEMLNKSIFYKLLFFPIYQDYLNFTKEGEAEIFFAELDSFIRYNIQYSLNHEFTRGNKIALEITGKEQEDIFNKYQEKGEINLLFKLNKETHTIFSITGFITAYEEKKELKIDFQLYELKNS